MAVETIMTWGAENYDKSLCVSSFSRGEGVGTDVFSAI